MGLTNWKRGVGGCSRRPWGAVLLVATVWLGGGLLAGCGGSGPGNGSKCSQCGDTDGPCDNPDLTRTVCWNDDQAECCNPRECLGKCPDGRSCSSDGECDQTQKCENISGKCSDDDAPCSSGDDCPGTGATCEQAGVCADTADDCATDQDCPTVAGECSQFKCEEDRNGDSPSCTADAECETCTNSQCWDDKASCTGTGECAVNPCLTLKECSTSGTVCSSDGDCGGNGATCETVKRCKGGRDIECSTDANCPRCVSERLACLRKLGSAERVCFDLNLDNTPQLQCGEKFSLAGTVATTPTPTPTAAPTATATATPTPTPTATP